MRCVVDRSVCGGLAMEITAMNWLVSDLALFGVRAQNWMLLTIVFYAVYFAYALRPIRVGSQLKTKRKAT
jgi:hypothetical protein